MAIASHAEDHRSVPWGDLPKMTPDRLADCYREGGRAYRTGIISPVDLRRHRCGGFANYAGTAKRHVESLPKRRVADGSGSLPSWRVVNLRCFLAIQRICSCCSKEAASGAVGPISAPGRRKKRIS
jgi:hypothetical protein